eukprot:363885-Chlamydomonas_euryale.AAC.5
MLAPEELLVHDIDQLQQLVRERKDEDRDKRRDKKDGRERDKSKVDGAAAAAAPATAAPSAPPTAMDTDDLEVPPASVLTLNGHDSEVYVVAWSPNEPLLASGLRKTHQQRKMLLVPALDAWAGRAARELWMRERDSRCAARFCTGVPWYTA